MKFKNTLLILIMCMIITACGRTTATPGDTNEHADISYASEAASGKEVLRTITEAQEIPLNEVFDAAYGMVTCGNGVVVAGEKEGALVIRMFPSDGNLSASTPLNIHANSSAFSCIGEGADGGFCVLYANDAGDSVLISYDEQGREKRAFSLSQGEDYYRGAIVLSEDTAIVWSIWALYLVRGDGNMTRIALSQAEWTEVSTVERLQDGTLVVIFYDESETKIAVIDTEAGTIDTPKSAGNASLRDYITVSGNLATPYLHTGQGLQQTNMDAQTIASMGWSKGGIEGNNIFGVVVQDTTAYLVLTYDLYYEKTALYTVRAEEKEIERRVITVGVMQNALTDVEVFAGYFNATNDEYSVRLRYYDEPMQLAADLTTGNAPDVLEISNVTIPLNDTNFLDMTTLMEQWPYITPQDFAGNLYHAIQIDGKLLYMPDFVSIDTVTARVADVGNTPGWTMEEFEQLMTEKGEEYAAFPAWLPPIEMLHYISYNAAYEYVDDVTGTCNFENDAFIKQLELCKNQPDEESNFMNYSDYNEHILLHTEIISNTLRMSTIRNNYGMQEFTFIGFPNNRGENGSFFSRGSLNTTLAIPAASPDPEGAWRFVSAMLDAGWQERDDLFIGGIPTAQESLERMLQAAMSDPDEDFNEEDYRNVMLLMETTNDFVNHDNTIGKIIEEEAQMFFADEISGEEAARRIQNRVTVYLDERSM